MTEPDLTPPPPTIVMVFLFKSAGANLRLIRRYLKEGFALYTLTSDKAYFRKELK